jgi:ACS family sodium-dependent inorganic phosphate cotransporter
VKSFGWPIPFYVFGLVGLVWAAFWFTKVKPGRGVPEESPHAPRDVPWSRLLKTPAVWAIVVSHFSSNWMLYMLLAWLPSYLKSARGFTLASAGLWSAAPWLASFVAANVAAHFAHNLLRSGRSATFVRKLMTSIGCFGGATFLLLLQTTGSPTIAVVLMCCASGSLACNFSGYAVNSFDIAPRHADVIWGISNTFATVPGIVGVAVTGWLVDRTHGYTAPFLLSALIAVTGGVVFLIAGSGERKIE